MVSKGLTALVVDTNVVFSALQKEGTIRNFLFSLSAGFYAPNFLIVEIFDHKEKILSLSSMSNNELVFMTYKIFNKIDFVNERFISGKNRKKAYEMCKDIDETDTPFLALALELNVHLWTGDKKLINGLRSKDIDIAIQTEDLTRYMRNLPSKGR